MNFSKMMLSVFLLLAMAVLCLANEPEVVNEIAETELEETEMDTSVHSGKKIKTFICASKHYKTKFCDVGEKIEKLFLIKQFSYKPCIEWKTYFKQKTGVTVTRGCQAKFGYTVKKPVVFKIKCTSHYYKKKICYVHGKIDKLYIHKVLSKYPCILWKTYLFGHNYIVVKWGCSAIFSYTLKH